MKYLHVVKSLQSHNNLEKNIPDLFLLNVGFSLLILAYFLVHITVVSILHDNAKVRIE